jgi:hypothetical protein
VMGWWFDKLTTNGFKSVHPELFERPPYCK